jgi:hypothetical protein
MKQNTYTLDLNALTKLQKEPYTVEDIYSLKELKDSEKGRNLINQMRSFLPKKINLFFNRITHWVVLDHFPKMKFDKLRQNSSILKWRKYSEIRSLIRNFIQK